MSFSSRKRLGLLASLSIFLIIVERICAEDTIDDVKETEDEIQQEIKEGVKESEVLQPLGPLKNSRVLRTTYYLSRLETDWFSARQHCIDHHLRLLSIEDLEEDSEITNFLNAERVLRVWTSANDLDRNGEFVWSSTLRSLVYTNWHRAGVRRDPRRNCVYTATDRFWGDGTYGWEEEYCANRMKFVCEETL
ncbi:Tetranectin-like protein [Orchesella cincta]|uniref:Tetranectin-like protein n=1 Tax=Orchesella cincta TaxID=48709 RepID=A0A1D2N5X0_ORCCI|nr:Tetranectin-like protein [Orchesella cincta]